MRQHSLRGVPAALLMFLGLATAAFAGARPELDVTQGMRAADGTRSLAARAVADPALLSLGRPASFDERFGVPTMLWADRTNVGKGFAAGAVRPNVETVARRHLGLVSGFYRLQAADVAAASLSAVHDIGTGGIIATFQQEIDGIPVFRDEIKVLMGRDLSLIAVSGYIPSQSLLTNAAAQSFALAPEAAIAAAFTDFTGRTTGAGALRAEGTPGEGGYQMFDASAALAGLAEGVRPAGPVRSRKTYFHTPDALLPAYYVEFMAPDQAYSYVVDANSGDLLFRHDLMAFDVFNYRVWAEAASPHRPYDGPQGNAPTPHPTGLPDFFAPTFQPPVLKSFQNGPISTNDPWLAPGASVTTGNNVDAYADLVTPDGFSAGDLRATSTSANTFDRTYDVNQSPGVSTDQRMAAITQLFYNNNFFHDWYYDSGFDEASGNGQTNNFGRGGLGNDAMRSEAQDFGGTNNANMSTPADGSPGRMQMYLFNPAGATTLTVPSGPAAGTYAAGAATGFGPQTFNVTGQLIVGVDGIAPIEDGCSGLANAAQVAGKIVLIDRGTCTFLLKVQNAAGAGAIGCIIVDNVAGTVPPGIGGTGTTTIPSLSVTQATGNALKAAIALGATTGTMFRAPSISRDGSLDNQIVAHEWGHFISNRLVGNASGLSTNMAGGLGEGWADFHAMLMSVRPEDLLQPANANWSGVYGLAGYALYPSVGLSNAFYFGIRRVPYSTNLNKNGLTFKHIQDGNALPPAVPTAFGQTGATNSEVHNTGEVWCTMLWECYAALLNDNVRLTFDQAQARMKQYIVAGYKLTPNAPTLLEARDAILAAALANDPQDFSLLWGAFAKRGAGVGAIAPDRFNLTNTGVVESFVTGGELSALAPVLAVDFRNCDSDGVLDNGEIGHITYTFRNSGSATVTNPVVTFSTTNPTLVSFPEGTSGTLPTLAPGQSASVVVGVELSGAFNVATMDVTASVTAGGFATPGPRTSTFYAYANGDGAPSTFETVETGATGWTYASTPVGVGTWSLAQFPNSPSHYLAGPDIGTTSDVTITSPPLQVDAGPLSFTFMHAFDFERDASNFYDGGVIEISNNNGATWTDVNLGLSPGYTGTLFTGTGASPLAGRSAYVGRSASYPALSTVTANLGTSFANQTVRIRFRIASDIGVGAGGWIVDNLAFSGLLNGPFSELFTDVTDCSPVGVGPSLPRALELSVSGPNPSFGRTALRFGLPTAQKAELAIYDVTGRKVATLTSGEQAAGWHQESWHANDDGSAPAAGVYFARLTTGSRTLGSRLVVLR